MNELKYFACKMKRGESVNIETSNPAEKITMLFKGMNQFNELQISFELSRNIMIKQQEKKPARKVRTL